MLKYTDTQVTFAEVPDEITLCINISNCPCHCKGCHSPYLAEDIGEYFDIDELLKAVNANKGVTCVAFMGGDSEPSYIDHLGKYIKKMLPWLKVAWYSGRQELSNEVDLWNFDYVKVGPYNEELGALDSKTTNQRFYKVFHFSSGKSKLMDWTYKFRKNETED